MFSEGRTSLTVFLGAGPFYTAWSVCLAGHDLIEKRSPNVAQPRPQVRKGGSGTILHHSRQCLSFGEKRPLWETLGNLPNLSQMGFLVDSGAIYLRAFDLILRSDSSNSLA